jgi:hypothetical protein
MNPLHPVVASELAAAHVQDLCAAADLDRAKQLPMPSRTRQRTGRRRVVVGPGVLSRRGAQVCRCT